MKILDYSSKGATIEFGQNELLLVMALVQRDAEIVGSDSNISERLDQQFTLANLLVEDKRRESVMKGSLHDNVAVISIFNPLPNTRP